jgi:hypothetical protein
MPRLLATSTACRDTYEQQLFECASRKYGLDEAILGFSGTGSNQAEASSMATTAAWQPLDAASS